MFIVLIFIILLLGNINCQLLRSASNWSIGLPEKQYEHSIYTAYLYAISSAQHYIFIENQFFISLASENSESPVKNLVAQAICERIKKAIREKQNFKVFVVMPLLPVIKIQKFVFILYYISQDF